jgi:hypothetical protein
VRCGIIMLRRRNAAGWSTTMMHTFSYQAQLADLGLSLACTYTSMATSTALALTSLAFTAPFVLAASARPLQTLAEAAVKPVQVALAATVDPYSAYRSDGGHATTLVIMGQMPSGH